jgi:transmembrane sensor
VLNTNSLIEVNFTDKYRSLELKRGEIHVRVAHDSARLFTVIAGDKIVKAIGTAFSLEITSDDRIELIVTEGEVVVGAQEIPHDATVDVAPDVQISLSVTVMAGEQLIIDALQEEIMEIPPEEIEVKLSWRQGNLVFRGESLEDAVAEIGRYTTVEFVILDDDLKKVRIAGLFKAGDVDGLLATLKENFDVSYQRTSDGRILLTSL